MESRVLVNSLPKSGTHLLAKAIELFGYREHFDEHNLDDPDRITPLFFNYREVKNALAKKREGLDHHYSPSPPPACVRRIGRGFAVRAGQGQAVCVGTLTPVYADLPTFRQWLNAMAYGRYILGHVAWTPALASVLADLNYHHLFIIRDPRAVVASLISFILDTRGMPRRHFLEADFELMSATQRLTFILEGGYAPQAGVEVRGFIDVYRSMFAWHKEPNCLFVRFEDLVGPQGGGTLERQKEVVKRIASHLGRPFDEHISVGFQKVYSPSARTFRKGSIDSWKQALDAKSIERLNEYCQPLCQEAGY